MLMFLTGFIVVLIVVIFSIFALLSDSIVLGMLAFIMLSIGLIVSGGFLTWVCLMMFNAIIFAITAK